MIEEWASRHDATVVGWYRDIDKSGKDLERPDLTELRRRWHEYDVAVAVKIDRWARSTIGFMTLADEAHEADCEIVAIKDDLDFSTPTGRFIATILAAFAQMERETIQARIKDGRATSIAAGRRQGGAPPLGYRKLRNEAGEVIPGKIEPDPDQVPIFQEAAQMLLAGESMRGVARWFETRLPSKSGRGYSVSSLSRTMRAELMTPILGETVRQKLIEVLAPKQRREWSNAVTLLSGIRRCGNCGGPMGSGTTDNGAHRYRCSDYVTGRNCSKGAAIQAHLIEPLVVGAYLEAQGQLPQTYSEPVANAALEHEAELKAEQQRLNASLPSLGRQQQKEALTRMDAIDDEIAELAEQLKSALYVIKETGLTMAEVWEQGDTLRRRELLKEWLPNGLRIEPAGGRYRPPIERLADPMQLRPGWADETTTADDIRTWLEGIWETVPGPVFGPKRVTSTT
jgi:DNA invertase Pin-like site-specific DNA recombinase